MVRSTFVTVSRVCLWMLAFNTQAPAFGQSALEREITGTVAGHVGGRHARRDRRGVQPRPDREKAPRGDRRAGHKDRRPATGPCNVTHVDRLQRSNEKASSIAGVHGDSQCGAPRRRPRGDDYGCRAGSHRRHPEQEQSAVAGHAQCAADAKNAAELRALYSRRARRPRRDRRDTACPSTAAGLESNVAVDGFEDHSLRAGGAASSTTSTREACRKWRSRSAASRLSCSRPGIRTNLSPKRRRQPIIRAPFRGLRKPFDEATPD